MSLSNLLGMGAANKTGSAMTNALTAANAEAEMETGAAEYSKIQSNKKAKLDEIAVDASKNRMAVNAKAGAAIQF